MTLQEKIREFAREVRDMKNEEVEEIIGPTFEQRDIAHFIMGCEYAYAQVVKLLKENNIDKEI